jgi:hypothetical protein
VRASCSCSFCGKRNASSTMSAKLRLMPPIYQPPTCCRWKGQSPQGRRGRWCGALCAGPVASTDRAAVMGSQAMRARECVSQAHNSPICTTSAATAGAYQINLGYTPGPHHSVTGTTPSGNRAGEQGLRWQEARRTLDGNGGAASVDIKFVLPLSCRLRTGDCPVYSRAGERGQEVFYMGVLRPTPAAAATRQ